MNKKAVDSPEKSATKRAPASEKEWRQAVENVCAELEWKTKIQTAHGNTLIICPLPTDERFMGALFVISNVEKRLALYLSYRLNNSPKNRNVLLEKITDINFGMLGGCLEFDSESGEVRYRDSLLIAAGAVDIELLRIFVAASLQSALKLHSEIEEITGTKKKSADDDEKK